MASYPFTPICLSAIRNSVPLPDWDGDLEQWAMSAHVQSEDEAVAEGLALVRAAMEKYDAEEPVSIPEALARCVEAGVLQVLPDGMSLAELWGLT